MALFRSDAASLAPSSAEPELGSVHEESIPGIIIPSELPGLLEIGLGRIELTKLAVSKAPQQVDPREVGMLGKAGGEMDGREMGTTRFDQTGGKIILGPEVVWLRTKSLLEATSCLRLGLLRSGSLAADEQVNAVEEFFESTDRREGVGRFPLPPSAGLIAQEGKASRLSKVVRPGRRPQGCRRSKIPSASTTLDRRSSRV